MEILPKQACEQSDSDELLQIVHRMPCTRHLSTKEKTILTFVNYRTQGAKWLKTY